MDRLNNLLPDEQLLADGLWYLGNMARTHECIAAVLARYHALEAELERTQQFLDESYGGGDGTEPLIERIGLALVRCVHSRLEIFKYYGWTPGARDRRAGTGVLMDDVTLIKGIAWTSCQRSARWMLW